MYRRVAGILLQCIPQVISDFALLQLAVDPGLLPRMVLAMEIDYHHFRLLLANMDDNGISVVQ